MGAADNAERRRHSRVEFEIDILVQVESGQKKIEFEGSCCDLSLKGIYIRTENRFVLGTGCSITVCLPGATQKIDLLMKGVIVRSDDNGMGIEFDSMDVDTYSHLKNIVKYNR